MSILVTVAGCGDNLINDVVPPQAPLEQTYWSAALNYRAINLSLDTTSNSVQLAVVARNAFGDDIPTDARPIFTSLDTARLTVTESGMLTAKGTGTSLKVIASLTIGTVTHADTALVKVTATPLAHPLATFSIHPASPDSTIWSWGGGANKTIRPTVLDSMNAPIANLQVAYQSSNKRIATIFASGTTNGSLQGIRTGKVWIIASTYAYGIGKFDSVEYSINFPVAQKVDVVWLSTPDSAGASVAFMGNEVTIGVGGYVAWWFITNGWSLTNPTPSIIFEDSTSAKAATAQNAIPPCLNNQGGNIYNVQDATVCPIGGMAYRQFDAPGTYIYHDGSGKATGKVIVVANPES